MLSALTYENMMKDLTKNKGSGKYNIGILLCNPKSEFAKQQILSRIDQFYHASAKYIDFYFPGYGAYWNYEYSDKISVGKVNGINWYFSERKYREFIDKLQSMSKWEYQGENELLIISYDNGNLDFSESSVIWLDKSVKDGSIYSVPNEFEKIFREYKKGNEIKDISNKFGLNSIANELLDSLISKSGIFGKMFKKSSYIVTKDLRL